MRRLSRVDRRALTIVAALSAVLVLPAGAGATSQADADALLAQSGGSLTSDGVAAGGDTGSLSPDAQPAGKSGSGAASTDRSKTEPKTEPKADAAGSKAAADELPFTGSDPRITMLLGAAAALAGAGLRLRTGDARDF